MRDATAVSPEKAPGLSATVPAACDSDTEVPMHLRPPASPEQSPQHTAVKTLDFNAEPSEAKVYFKYFPNFRASALSETCNSLCPAARGEDERKYVSDDETDSSSHVRKPSSRSRARNKADAERRRITRQPEGDQHTAQDLTDRNGKTSKPAPTYPQPPRSSEDPRQPELDHLSHAIIPSDHTSFEEVSGERAAKDINVRDVRYQAFTSPPSTCSPSYPETALPGTASMLKKTESAT